MLTLGRPLVATLADVPSENGPMKIVQLLYTNRYLIFVKMRTKGILISPIYISLLKYFVPNYRTISTGQLIRRVTTGGRAYANPRSSLVATQAESTYPVRKVQ